MAKRKPAVNQTRAPPEGAGDPARRQGGGPMRNGPESLALRRPRRTRRPWPIHGANATVSTADK